MEQERCAPSSKGGVRVLEADLWLSEPYMEMISEVVSRWDEGRLLSSRGAEPLAPLLLGSLERLGSLRPVRTREGLLYVAGGRIGGRRGWMEKGPMSPVSVVVLSMLSSGPGDARSEELLWLWSSRENGVLRDGPGWERTLAFAV
jgi:hypothetical protein